MQENTRRPLMYVGLHASDDPTRATLPFLVATGATAAEIDACIVLVGEAVSLARPGMIEAIKGVGFPPLPDLVGKVRDAQIPIYL